MYLRFSVLIQNHTHLRIKNTTLNSKSAPWSEMGRVLINNNQLTNTNRAGDILNIFNKRAFILAFLYTFVFKIMILV